MELSFEKRVITEENTANIPEINGEVRLSDSNEVCAKELLEAMESARVNGDV